MVFFLTQTTVYFFINTDMNKLFYSLAIITLLNANITHAENILIPTQTPPLPLNMSNPPQRLCLITGTPSGNLQYKVVKKIKFGKGTYGSVTDLYPRLHQTAEKYHADAVIHYRASQRFGFWPWRFVRPVISGTAIQWQSPSANNCRLAGGQEL